MKEIEIWDLDKKVKNFKFKGFIPNESLKNQCQDMYNLIENRCPSQCAKLASITRLKNDEYRVEFHVISNYCKFEIVSYEVSSDEAFLNKFYRQFLNHISDWKKNRKFS